MGNRLRKKTMPALGHNWVWQIGIMFSALLGGEWNVNDFHCAKAVHVEDEVFRYADGPTDEQLYGVLVAEGFHEELAVWHSLHYCIRDMPTRPEDFIQDLHSWLLLETNEWRGRSDSGETQYDWRKQWESKLNDFLSPSSLRGSQKYALPACAAAMASTGMQLRSSTRFLKEAFLAHLFCDTFLAFCKWGLLTDDAGVVGPLLQNDVTGNARNGCYAHHEYNLVDEEHRVWRLGDRDGFLVEFMTKLPEEGQESLETEEEHEAHCSEQPTWLSPKLLPGAECNVGMLVKPVEMIVGKTKFAFGDPAADEFLKRYGVVCIDPTLRSFGATAAPILAKATAIVGQAAVTTPKWLHAIAADRSGVARGFGRNLPQEFWNLFFDVAQSLSPRGSHNKTEFRRLCLAMGNDYCSGPLEGGRSAAPWHLDMVYSNPERYKRKARWDASNQIVTRVGFCTRAGTQFFLNPYLPTNHGDEQSVWDSDAHGFPNPNLRRAVEEVQNLLQGWRDSDFWTDGERVSGAAEKFSSDHLDPCMRNVQSLLHELQTSGSTTDHNLILDIPEGCFALWDIERALHRVPPYKIKAGPGAVRLSTLVEFSRPPNTSYQSQL